MTDFSTTPDNKELPETVSAPGNRPFTIWGKIYKFLSSAKLAMALLVIILACCLIGVTIFREERAGALIFGALWFNGLLVMLVVNVIFCFFPRIWRRKITFVSLGMILFHISFVAILLGIVYNSLYYFRGIMRLTEGETLQHSNPENYDSHEHGRFFSIADRAGETTLNKLHREYTVDGKNKKVAYEITVGSGSAKKQGILYITKSFAHEGFDYYRDKEGYSVLVVMSDKTGRELYGAYIPLQSVKQKDESYLYTTGTAAEQGSSPFPLTNMNPVFALQTVYTPSPIKERAGSATFRIWPLKDAGIDTNSRPEIEGQAYIGEKFNTGDYFLEVREVRYWVGMKVSYEPGQPIVLASMWAGLAGMIITFIGRVRRDRIPQSVVSDQSSANSETG